MSPTDLAALAVVAITALAIAIQERGYVRRARTWLNDCERRLRTKIAARRTRRTRIHLRRMLNPKSKGWANFKARG